MNGPIQEKKTHRVGVGAVLIASLPFQVLELTVLFTRTDVLNQMSSSYWVYFVTFSAFCGISLILGLAFFALDLIRGLIDRGATRPTFRRRLRKNLIPTFITVLGSAVIVGYNVFNFFTRQFINPEMIDWALFIALGCLIWWTIGLIVILFRIATLPKVNPLQKPFNKEYASSRRRWNHGIRKLASIITHPLVMPGYVIGIAVIMNAHWIGHVIDLSALSVLAVWVILAVAISPVVILRHSIRWSLWGLITIGFMAFPFMTSGNPQLTTVLQQHSLIVRHALKVHRFIPSPMDKQTPLKTGQATEAHAPSNETHPLPSTFELKDWAQKNRQTYPWPSEPIDTLLLDVRDWNILLLSIDSLRADHLSCYGYSFPTTPHIDALATQGVLFERHYTQGGDSIYSLNSLLSGMLPWNYRDRIDPVLSTILSQHGFATGYVGYDYVLKGGAFREGFETVALLEGDRREVWGQNTSRQIVDRIIGMIEQLSDRQFFIYSHLLDPHADYVINSETQRFDGSKHREYDGEIAFTDLHIGRLFEYLRQSGLMDRTLIVITADHGEAFNEHGHLWHGRYLYDESVRTPLIMTLPGLPGRRVQIPVGPVHVAPTILDFVGVISPSAMDGISLLPLAYHGDISDVTPVEMFVPNEAYRKRGWVYGPWKYIENSLDNTRELYNLAEDPGETMNVIGLHPDTQ